VIYEMRSSHPGKSEQVIRHVQPFMPSVTHTPLFPRPEQKPPGGAGPQGSRPVHEIAFGQAVRLQAHLPLGYRLQTGPAVVPSEH
jgi:hypothetical protein